MLCAFCNVILDKYNTKTVEHIIPQSLGNDNYVLFTVLICDKCNNYFAREIEKPFMELESINLVRAYKLLPSKKGKYVNIPVNFNGEKSYLEYDKRNNCFYIGLSAKTIQRTINFTPDKFVSPPIRIEELSDNYIVSRFLCKVFCEFLLEKLNNKYIYKQYISNYLEKSGFKKIFNFVRFGNINSFFSYSVEFIRNIYPLTYDDFIADLRIYKEGKEIVFMLDLFCFKFKLRVARI